MEEEKNIQTEVKQKKNIILTVLKHHKIGILIIIFLMMVSSTFAWFVYNKTVNMALITHVKSWNIELGDDKEGDTYEIKIDDLYPGMATIDTANGGGIPIVNNGEIAADISIEIISITLFGELQTLGTDYDIVRTDAVSGTEFKIDGYPFILVFKLSSDYLTSGASGNLNYTLEWDYENSEAECMQDASGNALDYNRCDAEDTAFGEKSYEFSSANPNDSSLIIQMKMNVTQSTN